MAYLDQAEEAQLETLRKTQPFANEVLRQCARILESHAFSRTQQRARDFLSFVVAKKLLRREAEIKETTIAIHVHEEPADYNPRSEEHTSELQSRPHLVCRLLLAKK